MHAQGEGFALGLAGGGQLGARGSDGHGRFRPAEPARSTRLDTFTGTVLHVSEYRTPGAFAEQRLVVVGAPGAWLSPSAARPPRRLIRRVST
ncbi:hypothetical protein AR457_01770 [Streptomyces agglomeratus]|nr:hypothetical protein AR457_01770 [Streptomyces agglomeratus]